MKERLEELIEEYEEDLGVFAANAADSEQDRNGSATSVLSGAETFLSVAYFTKNGDVAAFRSSLASAVSRRLTLYMRYDNGEPISASYVSMTPGNRLLQESLASANFELAVQVANVVGGRSEIEEKYDHAFDRSLGYATKHLVLRDEASAASDIEKFELAVGKIKADMPYVQILRSILKRDDAQLSNAVSRLESGHRHLAKSGRWKNTIQELVCLWGLGLWNLAAHREMICNATNCFIPLALVYERGAP